MKINMDTKTVFWSKEQMAQRKQIMEEKNPGYLAMNTRMSVFLGVVLMARFLDSGLSVALAPGLVLILFSALSLLIYFSLYRLLLQYNWKLAFIFLFFRFREIIKVFANMPSIFDLNFFGVMIYVVTVFVMAVDCSFLLYIVASKRVHTMVEHNLIVNSEQKELSLKKYAAMSTLEPGNDEESGAL